VSLAAARPSPFRATTVIEFALPARSPVTLAVFDVRGRCVRRLAAGTYDPGRHRIAWDGRGEDGRAVSSGVYFARLRAGREERTRRLVLVR
jgi:flagellar hook assembly protein FlgD